MDNEGLSKKKHPFVELFVATFFMLAVPFTIYIFFSSAMKLLTHYSPSLIACQSEAFAGLIGTAFAMMLIFSDFLNEPFKVVINRWWELFDNIRYGLWGVGLRCYLRNIWEHGIHFWWYLALTGFEVFLIVDGLKKFFAIVG